MIGRFPALCPNLERNRDILQGFEVDSPLTEKAVDREGTRNSFPTPPTTLPKDGCPGTCIVTLRVIPNLTTIDAEHNHHLDRLQGFHVAALENRRRPTSTPNPNKLTTFSEHPKALRSPHRPKYITSAQVLRITLVESELFLSPLIRTAERTRDTALLWWWLLFEGRRRDRN